MDEVVIYGAGKLGRLAGRYYEGRCDVVCFVDRDPQKWGTLLEGRAVAPPDTLEGFRGRVVIAVKEEPERIEEELQGRYGISRFLEFGVRERGRFLGGRRGPDTDCVVVEYKSGLGNQLFQYALAKYLEGRGRRVAADATGYSGLGTRRFELGRIFPNVCLRYASEDTVEYFTMKDRVARMECSDERYVHREPDASRCTRYGVSGEWGEVRSGILKGYFQTYLFADAARQALLRCLEFPESGDPQLYRLAEEVRGRNSVGVHVRRGDYMAEKARRLDGICDAGYYGRAAAVMREKVEDPQFYIFSDDIPWCRENVRVDGAVYVDPGMFADHEDWQDMYLMSLCRHNVIANSTFSWWAAWLNGNRGRITVAPRTWDNFCDLTNICPPGWIRL